MASILLIVTGASRGLGRSFSIAFIRKNNCLNEEIKIRALLIARSKDDLLQTEKFMHEEARKSSIDLDVSSHSMDLSEIGYRLQEEVAQLFQTLLPATQYRRAILINNAGSLAYLGNVSSVASSSSMLRMQQATNLNIVSSFWISIKPFKTMGEYCAFKAARDMYHTILAQENEGNKKFRVLNYAPGACHTEMIDQILSSENVDSELKKMFEESVRDGTLVRPDDSADRLARLVLSGNFQSGDHIDFWDELSPGKHH